MWTVAEIKDALSASHIPDSVVQAQLDYVNDRIIQTHGPHPEGQVIRCIWRLWRDRESLLQVPYRAAVSRILLGGQDADLDYFVIDENGMVRRRYPHYPFYYNIEIQATMPASDPRRRAAILDLMRIQLSRGGVASESNIGISRTYGDQQHMFDQIFNALGSEQVAFGRWPDEIIVLASTLENVYVGSSPTATVLVSQLQDGVAFGDGEFKIPDYTGARHIWFAQNIGEDNPTWIAFGGFLNEIDLYSQIGVGSTHRAWVSDRALNVSGDTLVVRR